MGLTECHNWEGSINEDGYGYLYLMGKQKLAHQVAWCLEYGSYPPYPERVIDHLCRNRSCVNVEHMELTSIGENVLRGDTITARQKAQTHCIRGHDLSEAPVYDGKRACRKCAAIRARERYHRRGE